MALTVEELQIVLSCDATTAQKVLKSMEATVKAYTDKFQKYFDQTGSKKGPKNFAADVSAIEKQLDNVTKAIDNKGKDWKKVYEKRWGETFEESMAKAKAGDHGEYVPSGKEIEWNPQGVYDPDYYNKATAEFDAAFNHAVDASADAGEQIRSNIAQWVPGGGGAALLGLADSVTSTLQDSMGGVENMPDTLRYKIEAVIDTVRNLGAAYTEALETNGAEDKGTIALQLKYQSAIYEADRYISKLDQIAAKEQQVETESVSAPTRFQTVMASVRETAEEVSYGIGSVGSRIKKAFDHSLLGKFVHQLGRVMLRMAAMKLIRGTIDAAKKGLEQLAKTSKSSAKAMNTIKAAGGSIKMALGAALMPIVKALAPVFVRLAGAISSASNALARFFAVVTGQSTYTAVNFSDSLDDVADSAGGAGKAVKGALADFDELIVIGKQAGGGGGSSGVEETLSTAADLDAVSELGTRIREAIERGDWRGVGEAIASKFNQAIRNWNAAETAQNISTKITNALDVAIGLLEEIDWAELGTKIGEFIAGLDWSGITSKVSEALGAALGAIGAVVYNAIAEIFGGDDDTSETTVAGKIQSVFDWIIDNVLKPFGEGFLKAAGLENALYNWELFCNKLKAAIGIAAEYINAVFAALKPVANDYVPYWEVLFARVEKEFKEFARDALQVVQDSWVLRKLFGDQSQLLFTLDCDIAAAEEKLTTWQQQVDAASEGLINIDANIDHEKVDGYMETLNTPFKTTIEPEVDEDSYTIVVDELNEVIGEKTATLNTVFDEDGIRLLQEVVVKLDNYDHTDATADLGVEIPPEAQKKLQSAWDNVSAYGKASGTASLGYGYAAGALNTLNGAKTSLSEYGQITANATIGINGAKAVTDALPTIKDAFNAVKDKTGKLTITQDKKNPKPKDLDKMATAYNRFKDDSTKSGKLNLTSSGDLLKTVGETLFLITITNLWNNLKAGTKNLKVDLDVDKTAVDFVAGWNKMSNKTLTFKLQVEDAMKNRWNNFANNWNKVGALKQLFEVKTLASGGIAYGPTPALVGEYAGAKSNPEVIAPLSSLVKLLTKANAHTGGTSSEEEMRLMRDQNAILRQLLAKKVEITPSVQLGQVIDRSQKLYART